MVVEQPFGRVELQRDIFHRRSREALVGKDFESGPKDIVTGTLGAPLPNARTAYCQLQILNSTFHTWKYEYYYRVSMSRTLLAQKARFSAQTSSNRDEVPHLS